MTTLRTLHVKELLLTAYVAWLAACGNAQVEEVRLADVGPFSARLDVAFSSPSAVTVHYGEGHLFDRATGAETPAPRHRVELTGLRPSTLYRYKIEPGGLVSSFRSAPRADGAFDLVLLSPEHTACMAQAENPPLWPDVVLLSGPCQGPLVKHPDERLVRPLPDQAETLVFGDVEIRLRPDPRELTETSESGTVPQGKRRLFVLAKEPAVLPETASVVLTPTAAFVHGKRIAWPKGLAAWLEVDAFEIAWVNAEQDKRERLVLVEAPPEARKTCLYCDRLLESGRYEESLAWYERFAVENPTNPGAQEDAAFNLARILDEKLFRYADARNRYTSFLSAFPQSRRATLIRYRLDYLNAYQDMDFEPLRRFEKAKAQRLADNPLPAARQVEAMLQEYPQAAVGQEALFWLGHLLEDIEPERAVRHYESLIERFPGTENAALSSIALGDMAYKDKRYEKAASLYQRASILAGGGYQVSIADKLSKSKRNVKREWVRWGSWLTLLAWAAFTVLFGGKPRRADLKTSAVTASLYALGFGAYFLIDYEKALPVVGVMGTALAASMLVFFWNRTLFRDGSHGLAAIHGLSGTLSVWYLSLYHWHYLYVFGV